MLGQIVYGPGKGRVHLERAAAAGLPVLRVELDPDSRWFGRKARRAGRLLARAGTGRVLTPEDFPAWPELERFGLRPVDPLPFLRFHAAELAVAALKRRRESPQRCAVALRGTRVDRDLERAALELCPLVRQVCIPPMPGGEALAGRLRWEYGMAVLPDFAQVSAAVRFTPQTWAAGETVLDLFPPAPGLDGVQVRLILENQEEIMPFDLLCALWEAGKVQKCDLEFT